MRRLYYVLAVLAVMCLLVGTACQATTATPTATAAPTPLPSPSATAEAAPSPTLPPVASPTVADEQSTGADAAVEYVRAVQDDDGTWTFHVTVRHPDTGWEDYADGWDVVTPDGTVLKPNPDDAFTRVLLHPHENEQPFTRSQRGIEIPEGATTVRVRAHDLVDGFGGKEVVVDLTRREGEDFEVERSD